MLTNKNNIFQYTYHDLDHSFIWHTWWILSGPWFYLFEHYFFFYHKSLNPPLHLKYSNTFVKAIKEMCNMPQAHACMGQFISYTFNLDLTHLSSTHGLRLFSRWKILSSSFFFKWTNLSICTFWSLQQSIFFLIDEIQDKNKEQEILLQQKPHLII